MTNASMNLNKTTLNNLTKKSNYSPPVVNLGQETKAQYICKGQKNKPGNKKKERNNRIIIIIMVLFSLVKRKKNRHGILYFYTIG